MIEAFGVVVALVLFLSTGLLLVPLRWPAGSWLLGPKLLIAALVPGVGALAGALAVVGVVAGLPLVGVLAGVAAVVAGVVWVRVAAAGPVGLGAAEGEAPVALGREPVARRRRQRRLGTATLPGWQRDALVGEVPGTGRALLGDLWSPPAGTEPSGLAIVYLHGSAWYVLDKDLGTRRLFRRLAGAGHTVLDLAYRLFPETDIPGMVQDTLRAVVWLRAQVSASAERPAMLVLAGGSAGGHLALLAAYAGHEEPFRPPELTTSDVEVQGVASMYGPADLAAMYHHTRQDRLPLASPPSSFHATVPGWARRLFGDRVERFGFERMDHAGRLDWLIGGRPDAVPERYARLSPLEHVHAGCPPTLLVHGTHDTLAPVAATRLLQQRLGSSGVPVTALYLPHTDHGFDLVLPRWSPAARTALQELQRFLAAIAQQPHTGHAKRRGPASASTSVAGPEREQPGTDPGSARP
jgi:acetyl esterase/lipase